jgi:phosphatidylserine/phosphatidylglycerophosphate/cardiolipin synthase-like enzyme
MSAPVERPETVEVGVEPREGARFVLMGSQDPESPELPSSEGVGWQIHWTDPRTPSIRDAMLSAIHTAQHDVWLCSYVVEDEAIVEALSAARKRGCEVFVIAGFREDRVGPHEEQLERLAKEDISIALRTDAHAKLLLVDPLAGNPLSLITSANADRASLDRNPEWGVVSNSPQIARTYASILWRIHGDPGDPGHPGFLDARRHGRRIRRSSRGDDCHGAALAHLRGGERARVEPLWTLADSNPLQEACLEICEQARPGDDLLLASFSLAGLQRVDSQLGRAIKAAQQRGVRVRFLTRPHDNLRAAHLRCCEEFRRIGVEIRGSRWIHAKGIALDAQRAVAFSANLDEDLGMAGGFEAGVLLYDPEAAEAFSRGLERLWSSAAFRLVANAKPDRVAAVDEWLRAADHVAAADVMAPNRLLCPAHALRSDGDFEKLLDDLELEDVRVGRGDEGELLMTVADTALRCQETAPGEWTVATKSSLTTVPRRVRRHLVLVVDSTIEVCRLGAR